MKNNNVDEVADEIFRIRVPLPGSPLKEINTYFIRGKKRDLLIDTGFRNVICRNVLNQGLAYLHSDIKRRDVLITHCHSDHVSMADLFVGRQGHVYVNGTDLDYFKRIMTGEVMNTLSIRYVQEGFPSAMMNDIMQNNFAIKFGMPIIDDRYVKIQDNDLLHVGNYTLKAILTPGHTPGNMIFYDENNEIMFCGDHVLFDISPNITPVLDVADPLGDYMNSLKKAEKFSVIKAFPGHRGIGPYKKRIKELQQHHIVRLEEVIDIVKKNPGITAYDIAAKMSWQISEDNWDAFPLVQKYFAMCECIAHIDYLVKVRLLNKENKGVWCYEP